MKNPYAKGKGRIHPSPSGDALAVLRTLPAAILTLTAALGNGDKEVLAYLITRSIAGLEESPCGKSGQLHTRLFGCGCFQCYTCFWSRWDRSPARELIHLAIEGFEDHLAKSERVIVPGKGNRKGGLAGKGKKRGKEKERLTDDVICEVIENPPEEQNEQKDDRVAAERLDTAEIPAGGDRRKGWADVTSIFNSRLWSLWSPGD